MSGQTNLSKALNSLHVSCDEVQYGFATIKDNTILPKQIIGTFQEKEGLTVIAPIESFKQSEILFEGPYARLTIEVHTSLDLVGFTAVFASKLAENNISANVVAGYFHDHIFVQYSLKEKAIDVLNNLKGE